VVRLCAVIATLALLVRALMLWWPLPGEAVYQFSICRMDALALGGAAAAALREPAWRERIDRTQHRLLPAALLVFALGALCSGGYRIFGAGAQTLGYSALAVAAALLVLWAAGTDSEHRSVARRLLQQRALRRVGRYSYGLYVLHVPLHLLIGLPLLARWGLEKDPGAAVAIVYMAAGTTLSLAAALLSYHAFEVHFLRLKRWFPMHQRHDST
jgi:peptidoglycan/LPS O-acetylase OafA/YrhL